ncbi:hypothetical protein GCM10010294_36340 [Streptomyces griseoloalbus]|nr:hypothetical protein GCM10010294_36340 [Streptomyces griseoloalbus]
MDGTCLSVRARTAAAFGGCGGGRGVVCAGLQVWTVPAVVTHYDDVIEGINWTGIPVDGFAHGRPTLEPVRHLSHTLVDSGKLVYSAHFYGYTGPNHSGATGIGETTDPRYQDLPRAELTDVLYRQAFFVTDEPDRHFTAPVWISEFGVGGRAETGVAERAWFENFVDHLIRANADFAYWPLVGWHENRRGNGWALLHWDAAGHRMGLYDGDDWRAGAWTRLGEATGRSGHVLPGANWSMLSPDHTDFVASRRMRAARLGLRRTQGRLPRRTAPPGPEPHRQPGAVFRRDRRAPGGPLRWTRSGQGRAACHAGR